MKRSQALGAVMGAALLSGIALANSDRPSGPGFRDEDQGMTVPRKGPEGEGMQRGGSGPQGGRERVPNPEQLREAGATEPQLEALKAFVYEQKIKRIELQASVEKAELQLEQLRQSTRVDEKATLKAADDLTQARGDLFKLEIIARIKIRQILGEETMGKLQAAMRNQMRERGMHRERGPRGEPDGMDLQGKGAARGPDAPGRPPKEKDDGRDDDED